MGMHQTNLQKREEVVELLACSPSVKKHAACLKHCRDESNTEKVIGHIESV
jgi:hypothetical protein